MDDSSRKLKVDFVIEGKGTLKDKGLEIGGIEGNVLNLEGMAGVLHRVMTDGGGVLGIGNEIYSAGDYNPDIPVKVKIVPVDGEVYKKGKAPDEIIFGDQRFYRYNPPNVESGIEGSASPKSGSLGEAEKAAAGFQSPPSQEDGMAAKQASDSERKEYLKKIEELESQLSEGTEKASKLEQDAKERQIDYKF